MKKPSYNIVHHLSCGRVVLREVGYVNGEYVYDIRGNLGNIASVDGMGELGRLTFDLRGDEPKMLRIEIESNLLAQVFDDLGAALGLVAQGWRA